MTDPAPGGRIAVLLNASAGLSRTDAAVLQERLGAHRVDVTVVPAAALKDRIRALADGGARIVGVAGGDGTQNAAATVLTGTRTALLPVPTGTLNNFAQRVGISGVEDAAAALDGHRIVTLPVGTAAGHIFLNTLTFGEYSRIVRMRETYRRGVGKWPAAALAFTIALLTLRRISLTLHTEDAVLTRRTPFVWVGVGWGSFPRVQEALERRHRPDLEVAVLRSPNRLAGLGFVFRLGVRMALHRLPVRDRALELLHTRELRVDSHRLIDATADGEVLRLQPPVDVGIRDDALRVVAPTV